MEPFVESTVTRRFRAARDVLITHRGDLAAARAAFEWPRFTHFNWATDWFDPVARRRANDVALWVTTLHRDHATTFGDLAQRSRQVATWLADLGVGPGERILVCLRNGVALYEIVLAAMRLQAVVIPTYTTVGGEDLLARLQQAKIGTLIVDTAVARRAPNLPAALRRRIVVGRRVAGWLGYRDSDSAGTVPPDLGPTAANTPLFAYFTSGTTSQPKLVLHSHVSYPVGHLSSLYWNGVRPGDVHLNVSSPGWAKHSWSSLFVPWNAEATLVVLDVPDATPELVQATMRRRGVSTFCAPPTFWRRLIREGMGQPIPTLRDATSAGEPLEAPVISAVRSAWNIELRDGYGQTETTAQIGNAPGVSIVAGSMGLPLPGYDIELLQGDDDVPAAAEGEVAVRLTPPPVGMMLGYDDEPARTAKAIGGAYYRTGDLARRDADGRLHFIGRVDDMFKAFDYRVSPFELERALAAHPAVGEVAIVPRPDQIGALAAKAFVRLRPGHAPTGALAEAMITFMAERVATAVLPRAIEFVEDLPKTSSGKLLRRALKVEEAARQPGDRRPGEFEIKIGADLVTAVA